jgi:hypothetical protein
VKKVSAIENRINMINSAITNAAPERQAVGRRP